MFLSCYRRHICTSTCVHTHSHAYTSEQPHNHQMYAQICSETKRYKHNDIDAARLFSLDQPRRSALLPSSGTRRLSNLQTAHAQRDTSCKLEPENSPTTEEPRGTRITTDITPCALQHRDITPCASIAVRPRRRRMCCAYAICGASWILGDPKIASCCYTTFCSQSNIHFHVDGEQLSISRALQQR